MIEEWRPVPGYERLYEVSSLGRLRSLRLRPPRVLVATPNADGYPIVQLCNGGRKIMKLHRVVALTFHGEMQNALHCEVAHLDGVRDNARADNLKWVSKVENHSHKRLHGTHQAGERHPRAKLTEANVIAIRRAAQPYGALAEKYGVSYYTIYDIKSGKSWKSLS